MAIVISGYTAAGKTTHGRLLAAALGYEHIWAAGRLLAELGYVGVDAHESELWYGQLDEINERRRFSDADAVVDALLVECSSRDDVVLDSRFLPWIDGGRPTAKVWLESDLLSRARKCECSLRGIGRRPNLVECAQFVHYKDGEDIRRVAETYGGVFGQDAERIDLAINISQFATRSSFGDLPAAISRCSEFVVAAVRWKMGDTEGVAQLAQSDPGLFREVYAFIPGLSSAV